MFGGVDADIVDEHGLRVGGGGVGGAGPVAANGDVEDQEVGVVEDPGAGDFGRGRGRGGTGDADRRLGREGGEFGLVDVEANLGGFPFNSVGVEAFGEVFAAGEAGRSGEIGGGAVGKRAVDRAVDDVRLLADVFHDVDLAALGPADRMNVVAEHPESGPDPLPLGNFDAGFETAEGLGEEALRFQARGSVLASDVIRAFVIFFARGDDEIAVLDAGIYGAVGVGFELVVAPAIAAEIVGPFLGVGSGTVGGVEFVGPN